MMITQCEQINFENLKKFENKKYLLYNSYTHDNRNGCRIRYLVNSSRISELDSSIHTED